MLRVVMIVFQYWAFALESAFVCLLGNGEIVDALERRASPLRGKRNDQ